MLIGSNPSIVPAVFAGASASSNIITILFIALSLSADCFAVSLSASMSGKNRSRIAIFRTALAFGMFQAVMPVIGWFAGRTVVDIIRNFDHWVAFGLLAFVGGKMVWESIFEKEKEDNERDISKGLTLITLSFATSIDALAVGLSFAFIDVNIWVAAGVIGIIAFLITGLGFVIGKKVGGVFGKRAELIGGLVLIGIGLKIIIEHLIE